MMNRLLIIAAGAFAAVAGCASTAGAPQASADAPGAAAALGPLPDAGIPKGACGMVLWTLDNERPQAVFRFVAGKEAEIVLNGAPVRLALVESSGAAGFGVHERQSFAAPGGVTMRTDTRFALGFDGGSYLERGVISIDGPDGWRTVVPAAGLAGCRSS